MVHSRSTGAFERKKNNYTQKREVFRDNFGTYCCAGYEPNWLGDDDGDENYECNQNSMRGENLESKSESSNEKREMYFCLDEEEKKSERKGQDNKIYMYTNSKNGIKGKNKNDHFWDVINNLDGVYKRDEESNDYSSNDVVYGKQNGNNLPNMKISKKYVEVGCLGIWKLSSRKNMSDIKKLKDDDANTYWQSASLGPHTITIQFFKLTKISKIYLLFNYLLDESYTPYELLIKVGNDENHLEYLCSTFCDIKKFSHKDPFWFIIDFKKYSFSSYLYNFNTNILKKDNFIYCHCLQVCVLSSQHYGKDTRIRQVKIFSPRYSFYKHDKMIMQKWV
ncbi:anaphase-promoting complex subunit 10, putative [Plasmodium ovale]|uniref:Anaphase promoting complex subunit 10, putative n=2 Tax=Plasmodium ovale TaxID=36330 RepID=A0A1A8X107_PLAOA|nr:anaphase promoting complex subunit 10, putative [Plasmodium ovale curtisi]SBS98286.1 anaphase promoting complex subunit 10, putative [Plasmodium ovale curtisi]SCQ16993.1 anaphase-promoting complex subunit 10, putative [Plasmodium ovale]